MSDGDIEYQRKLRMTKLLDEHRKKFFADSLAVVAAERDRYKMWWELSQENLGEVMHENAQNARRAQAMYQQVKKYRKLLEQVTQERNELWLEIDPECAV